MAPPFTRRDFIRIAAASTLAPVSVSAALTVTAGANRLDGNTLPLT